MTEPAQEGQTMNLTSPLEIHLPLEVVLLRCCVARGPGRALPRPLQPLRPQLRLSLRQQHRDQRRGVRGLGGVRVGALQRE